MITVLQWFRVTRQQPCRICEKSDWCTWQDDGTACCMRVESEKPMKNGGWLHKGESKSVTNVTRHRPTPKPKLAWSAFWTIWNRATTTDQLDDLAATLGVSYASLESIGAVWAQPYDSWAFPMRTAGGVIVGFRLRPLKGKKFAVKYSTNALFMPWPFKPTEVLYVTEGESDLAALITIGLNGIGRPSCSSCVEAVKTVATRFNPALTVIIADNDDPGLGGAAALQQSLTLPSIIWTPPTKDLREFVKLGGTRQMIESAVRDTVPERKP